MDFIKRSSGSFIEKQYDILTNLFLIKNGVRRACLISGCDYGSIEPYKSIELPYESINTPYKILYFTIKELYPEFVYTLYHLYNKEENDSKYSSFFVSLSELPKFNPSIESYDKYTGKMLEYSQWGIPDDTKIRYVLSYYTLIDNNKYNFSTEIVSNRDMIVSKKEKFQKILEELDWIIEETITETLPMNFYLNVVVNKGTHNNDSQWLYDREEEFKGIICGYGWTMLEDYSLKDLMEKHYDWLLFITLLCIYDPFSVIYPIHTNEAEIMEQKQKQFLKKNIDNSPILLIDELLKLDFIKKYLDLYINNRNSFNNIKNNLINEYNKLL